MTELMDDEAYVRQRWEHVHKCDGSYRDYPRGTFLLQEVRGEWRDFPTLSAAKAFTVERERQIAFREAEIDLVCETRLEGKGIDHSRWTRILELLQAALAELRRGMKP